MKPISDFSKARVGDRCWSPFGPDVPEGETNGVIAEICRGRELPIEVRYDDINIRIRNFTVKGYYNTSDSFPTLFWCRPEIKIPEPPKRREMEVEVRPVFAYGSFTLHPVEEIHPKTAIPVQKVKLIVEE